MALSDAELRRLRMAIADLSGAAYYMSQIDDEAAQAIVAAIRAVLADCQRLMEE